MIVPGNTFGDYLLFICRLIGRYGSRDGDVMLAMVRLVRTCLEVGGHDPGRLATLSQALGELESDADGGLVRVNERSVSYRQPTTSGPGSPTSWSDCQLGQIRQRCWP